VIRIEDVLTMVDSFLRLEVLLVVTAMRLVPWLRPSGPHVLSFMWETKHDRLKVISNQTDP